MNIYDKTSDMTEMKYNHKDKGVAIDWAKRTMWEMNESGHDVITSEASAIYIDKSYHTVVLIDGHL